jgi:DNA segregation ATPase FtsK/SpoIIIE-like protein
MIQGLLHRFSPDELNLYLFDYKDGVEFDVYAKSKSPQIKFVATVNDSEYGITTLKWFQEEIARRNEEFKRCGVRNISRMRELGKQMAQILINSFC